MRIAFPMASADNPGAFVTWPGKRNFMRIDYTYLLAALLTLPALSANADEWPQWGGPQQDLVWREPGIVDSLPAGTLPRRWSTPIGEGYSGPAVAGGMVFVTDRVHGQARDGVERVHALNANTGEILWTHSYPCEYTISYPAGPRATPVYDDGRLYTVGAVGDFFCFDAKTGAVQWSKKFTTDYGTELPTWGMAAAPIIDGEQLIALAGGPNALVVSLDKKSGRENWRALHDPIIGYCPPVIFDFAGKRQLIQYHPQGVSSLDPETGKLNWEYPLQIQAGLTIATPRKLGNELLVTAFYNGSVLLDVAPDASGAKLVWRGKSNSERDTDGLHGLMCTPWYDKDCIYGVCSYGQLRCIDSRNGRRIWETFEATGEGRWWNAFLVRYEPVPNRFFIHNEQGELIIADLTKEGYREISRSLLVEPTRPVQRRMTIWSHPAFAHQSVFARNDKEIVRVNLAKE